MKKIISRIKKTISLETLYTHHFLGSILNKNSTVIDLGANEGQFSRKINQKYGCKCSMIEPDPELFDNLPDSEWLKKHNYCISNEDGPVTLYISENKESNSLSKDHASNWDIKNSVQVQGVSYSSLLKKLGYENLDLLKIDIEGFESDLLLGMTDDQTSKIGQITVEFHDFINPRQLSEIKTIIRKFEKRGFRVINFTKPYNYVDVLFINTNKHILTIKESFILFLLEHFFFNLRYLNKWRYQLLNGR